MEIPFLSLSKYDQKIYIEFSQKKRPNQLFFDKKNL